MTNQEIELSFRTFEKELPELMKTHAGEYVIIKGDQIIDFKKSYNDALLSAYKKYGKDGFFVRCIELKDSFYLPKYDIWGSVS